MLPYILGLVGGSLIGSAISKKEYEQGGDTDVSFKVGGVVDEIGGWKRNTLGTLSFDMKIKGMRKPQEFIVYPISMGDTQIKIQSDTRIGVINMDKGDGKMSQSHPNGAYGVHLAFDKLIDFQLTQDQFSKLKTELAKTSGKQVGSVIISNNEGASQFI